MTSEHVTSMNLFGRDMKAGDRLRTRIHWRGGDAWLDGTIKYFTPSHRQAHLESGWCTNDYNDILEIHEPKP